MGRSRRIWCRPSIIFWVRCGVGSSLDPETLEVRSAEALEEAQEEESASHASVTKPSPSPLLPEMKDELVVTNSIRALSPRIVAVHGPTGTGKSTVFPLAVAHWTYKRTSLKPGLTSVHSPEELQHENCAIVSERIEK